MKKQMLIILCIAYSHNILAQQLVLDLETHSRLNNINSQQLKHSESLTKIDSTLKEVNTSLTGRYTNQLTTVNNQTYNQDVSQVNQKHTLKNTKIQYLQQEIDKLFATRNIKVSSKKLNEAKQQQQTQEEMRQAIIYSSSIINNSKTRKNEIENLVTESSRTEDIKHAIDLQNKIAIETLIEMKRNNVLLALLVRNQAKERYQGMVNITEYNKQNSKQHIRSNNNSLYSQYAR